MPASTLTETTIKQLGLPYGGLTEAQITFAEAFQRFMTKAQEAVTTDYAKFSAYLYEKRGTEPAEKWITENTPVLETMRGGRYVRLVSTTITGGQRSCFGFVDTTNGDVLKSASWKRPAKNFARGSIYDEQNGCGRIRWTGVG